LEQKGRNFNYKTGCMAAGVLACLLFSFVLKAPGSLEEAAAAAGSSGTLAMRIFGITILAIFWWIANVIPDWLTTIAMMLLWILIGGVPFGTAFGSFAGTSVWIVAGAICFAAAIGKSGLFNRISWFLLKIFPPTFPGQVLALLLVGTVCSPMIPSTTAKVVLGATIATGLATAMGYGAESPGRYGLFAAAMVGFSNLSPAFVSASVFGYTLLGALPEGTPTVTWGGWFVAMIPWLVIVLSGSFFAIRLLYRPQEQAAMSKEYAGRQYEMLGKLEGKELWAALILAGAVVLWILEDRLGIPAAVTAMIATFLCFALGLLDFSQIHTAPNWSMFIFLGGVLSLGTVFSRTGINAWLQRLLAPVFARLDNPYLVAVIIILTVLLIRFILVSQSATIIIMMTILGPSAPSLGLSPFIVGILVYTAELCWFVPYQNVVYATAMGCTEGKLSHRDTVKACAAYEVLSLIGCLVSIPYWRMLGML
jgi:DASS family divalent anion:Na+ symporter